MTDPSPVPAEASSSRGWSVGPASGRALWLWSLGVTLGASLLLLAVAPLYKPTRLHVQDMYVDQMGYITSARILVDTGELRNGVLLPSQVRNPKFRPYMPGHYLALASSYALFGYSALTSLLPSLASFVLVALGLFLVGNRLYGRFTGALAAWLFAVYPGEITYAFTAMAELTFTFAGVLALVILVHLPRRWWSFAPPVLLALPFLFRESGAFLILPLAALVLHARGFLAACLTSLGSVATLYGINRWQIASGKLQASLSWVTEGGFNYYNAFPAPEPELTRGEFLAAIGSNVERNVGILGELLSDLPGELMPAGLIVILVLAPILLVGSLRRFRTDPFPLGAALLLLLVLGLTVTVYDVQAHKMMRTALFVYPFAALALAALIQPDERLAERTPTGRARGLAAVVAVSMLAGSVAVCARAGERMTRRDDEMAGISALLADLHDETTVIVGPPTIAPMYAVEHYPVLWSFPIAGLETYRAVFRRYTVGTLLSQEVLPNRFIRSLGLRPRGTLESGSPIYVYVRNDG